MHENVHDARAVMSNGEPDSQVCQEEIEVGRGGSRDGASLRRRNQRQISRIFQELLLKHGPDLSALSLEEINDTAAKLIWEKSDLLQDSKGGEE